MLLLWVLLPIALFGIDGTIQLYTGWRAQVAQLGNLDYHTALDANRVTGPPIVTLHKALVNLTGEGFHSATTQGWLWALRIGWVAVLPVVRVAMPALPARRHPVAGGAGRLDGAADRAAAGQPLARAVPRNPAAGRRHVVHCGCPRHRHARRDRGVALAALAALAVSLAVRVPFPVRGLEMLAQFFVLIVALGLLRPRLARTAAA